MINIVEKAKCSGCCACVEICPERCIDLISDAEGFWYPKVNEKQCINCTMCEKVCPITIPKADLRDKPLAAYAAMHKTEDVRLKSSSGGVFSLLATYVLEQGGVVFGAAFDENFNVIHKYIENITELDSLQGSKYVQSLIGDTYRQAEVFLKSGRLVLFSGTPCQIEGLLAYLKKSYENLITQDLICHGVPSPMVWQKYIKYREAIANSSSVQKISFRSKNTGWKGYSVFFSFENGEKYQVMHDKDPMMQAFLNNLCLRPSCYECAFKTKARRSDITLADFWGIKNVLPDMDDDKGTSLVLIQSPKGQEMFLKIKDSLSFVEVAPDIAISYNSSMTKSATLPKNRNAFLRKISVEHFLKITKKYSRMTFKGRVKSFVVKCVRTIKKSSK